MRVRTSGARPASVAAAAALALLQGLLDIGLGSVLLWGSSVLSVREAAQVARSRLVLLGVAFVVVGAVTLVVAASLRRGSGRARAFVTATMLASIAVAVSVAAVGTSTSQAASAVLVVGLALLVVVLLWNRRANAFFGDG